MGGLFSSAKEEEVNVVDSKGHVNNNIVIQAARDTHEQMLMSESLLWATLFMCLCEIIKLFIYVYNAHNKKIKRKYQSNNQA